MGNDYFSELNAEIQNVLKKARQRIKRPKPPVAVYEQGVVCWIDILGFGAAVRKTIMQNGKIAQQEVNKIASAIQAMRKHFDRPKELKSEGPASMRVEQSSDSIRVSSRYTYIGSIISVISRFFSQNCLELSGIPYTTRGRV